MRKNTWKRKYSAHETPFKVLMVRRGLLREKLLWEKRRKYGIRLLCWAWFDDLMLIKMVQVGLRLSSRSSWLTTTTHGNIHSLHAWCQWIRQSSSSWRAVSSSTCWNFLFSLSPNRYSPHHHHDNNFSAQFSLFSFCGKQQEKRW